ncbi:MAG: NYN domain-containing protein [Kiritimatiellota bacterium]|nr:NYN domain-containing protein [Kiritimatiellota bacterium]
MTRWLIIDGYNLIHRTGNHLAGGPTLREVGMPRDLAGKRRHLIQLLEKTVGILAERITVVFDGHSSGDGHSGDGPDEQESQVVEVLFSPRDKTADTVIEQLVFQAGLAGRPACNAVRSTAGRVVVVTSDRLERETTDAAGAETMACSVFLDQLNETLARIEQNLRLRGSLPAYGGPPSKHPATPLGNPFSSLDINKPGETP